MSWKCGRLMLGLALFGFSVALMLDARLGVSSWDVLHQGIALRTGLSIGWVVNLTAAAVLLLWIPLGQRPGLGTVANVLTVGPLIDLSLELLPDPDHWATRVGFLACGIVLNGLAIGLYVGAGLGPGPRDGLMTGLAARGHPVWKVRTGIEAAVVSAGWALGGTVGIGTVAYAASIGPLAHYFIPRLTIREPECPSSKS